jgi:hypothetical protein
LDMIGVILMERFWNIVHYFIYRAQYKFYLFLHKINPTFYILKARFLKAGITEPEEYYNKIWTKPASEYWSWGFIFGLVFLIFIGIANIYSAIIKETNLQLYHFIIFGILSVIINHLLLFRHDKYLKYFKKFDKMQKAERTKWAWISFLVVLSVIIFFFGSFMILTYRLHHCFF